MPDNWNGLRLGALGFQPPSPPSPMPEIPPELLLQLLGNRPPPPSPLGFGALQHLLGGGQPEMQNPLSAGPPPVAGAPPPAPLGFQPPMREALGPQTPEEEAELARSARAGALMLEALGISPLRRSGLAAAEGNWLSALGNAGAAATPYKPALGLGMLGTAYGGAVGSDLASLLRPNTAMAQGQPPPAGQSDDGLTAAERSRRELLRGRSRRLGDRLPEAEQNELGELDRTAAEYRRARNAATIGVGADRERREREEYDRTVQRAEQARDRWLARDVRFSGTRTGNLFEETGGFAPLGFGALSGLFGRSARGAVGWGAGAGAASAHMPLGFNATFTEPDNPIRRAFEEYSRELPPTHPRREEWLRYAEGLPRENPVRREALDQLSDPFRFAARTAVGGVEGALGGHIAHGLRGMASGILGGRGPTPPPAPAAPPPAAPPAPPPAPLGIPPPTPPPPAPALPPRQPSTAAPDLLGPEPPFGARWSPSANRWILGNQFIGGPNRWPHRIP